MARVRRVDVGRIVYHALNRANFRSPLFKKPTDYEDFLAIVEETLTLVPMRLLAYCLMPNHWHMVLHPRADGDLAKFLQRITLTHTQRHHAKTRTVGTAPFTKAATGRTARWNEMTTSSRWFATWKKTPSAPAW